MTYSFQETQLRFTRYLRDPQAHSFAELPQERMQVYNELIYNNIENFLASAFPVMRSIINNQQWHSLVRDFIRDHQARTPYFLEISQEFLNYFLQSPHPLVTHYPFLTALAHYEWVELAIDILDEDLPETHVLPINVWATTCYLSPLSLVLFYPWPVHKISSTFLPQEQSDTHLLVYRNRDDQVKFMELSTTSSRFLQLCRDNPGSTPQFLADLLQQEVEIKRPQVIELVQQLHAIDVIYFGLSQK